MKRAICFLGLAAIALVLGSCLAPGEQTTENHVSDLRVLINQACFEVVVKKPETDSLVYETELPWDLIDYNIRNDKYFPVGTAFAISEDELVSAAHVLEFMDDSINYAEYYIRDSAGNVFEIDQILSFHTARDFVRFTVKDKKFGSWFKVRNAYQLNEPLYAVGNIYGQGLVAVPGTLLGTLAEPENGLWKFLKSSPPNDKGSSGGPLLDAEGNVIGIITAKDDNFCYSLPIAEMQHIKKDTGLYHRKFTYRFILFPEKTEAIAFDCQVALPKHYRDVKTEVNLRFKAHNQQNMAKLFRDNQANIFPNGNGSLMALHDVCSESDMQVFFKDENDLNWYISELEKEISSLADNGSIRYQLVNATYFIDLVKPDDIGLGELYAQPELAMDLILKGINMPRQFAGQDIRIVSLGKPYKSDTHVDAFERKWQIHQWPIEYSDQVAILLSTPTPDGMVCMLQFVRYHQRDVWMWDLKKTADFVYIPYYGTLQQWAEFLNQKQFLYGSLLDTQLAYQNGEQFLMNIEDVRIDFSDSLLDVHHRSELSLIFDFYPNSHKTIWGLRKVVYSEARKDNFFVLYRFLRPHAELPHSYLKEWESVIQKRHPYNGVPYTKEGRTNIGFVHPFYAMQDSDVFAKNQYVFTVYFAKEGNVKDTEIENTLQTLQKGIQIIQGRSGFPNLSHVSPSGL